ncbi:unnamed protein product [Macrosiphum euphorbiae]|uniref:Regulatory protein zeste n=1 Tax=Macrosiphum euphorbiae TaxID=13131 RepID=A0AAV0WCL9_9HEMI|nr:unnamed protein product [Macrosiphum euphorbiae]
METKKKSKSVTYEQKQLLIDFVHKHPKLNTKKFGPSFTMKDSQLLWQNISKTLNETIGPKKTWVEWRKCFQYLKSAAKQKVPSKSHYNKTGGGEKQDEECIDQADEQLLDILGHTAIHGHDTVPESTCTVSFLHDNTDNVLATEDTEELVLVNMHAEEDSNNLDVITISVNSNNSNEEDNTEKANESDPFDQFIGTVIKRSLDNPFEEDLQNTHNKYTTHSPHLVIIHLISYSSTMSQQAIGKCSGSIIVLIVASLFI